MQVEQRSSQAKILRYARENLNRKWAGVKQPASFDHEDSEDDSDGEVILAKQQLRAVNERQRKKKKKGSSAATPDPSARTPTSSNVHPRNVSRRLDVNDPGVVPLTVLGGEHESDNVREGIVLNGATSMRRSGGRAESL